MKTLLTLTLILLVVGGCVHVRQGEFEYWRFGPQQIGEALLTLPDGSELLLEGQKAELPIKVTLPNGIIIESGGGGK